MPSPFPGMNPYLENPAHWPSIHHRLIVAIANDLAAKLNPNYFVAIEVRMYETAGEESTLVGIPDNLVVKGDEKANLPDDSSVAVAAPPAQPITITVPIPETVKQGYLEVKDIGSGEVITTLEILSHANKKAGEGREKYEAKRLKVLGASQWVNKAKNVTLFVGQATRAVIRSVVSCKKKLFTKLTCSRYKLMIGSKCEKLLTVVFCSYY